MVLSPYAFFMKELKASGEIAKIIASKEKKNLYAAISARYKSLSANELKSLKERAKNTPSVSQLIPNMVGPSFYKGIPKDVLNSHLNIILSNGITNKSLDKNPKSIGMISDTSNYFGINSHDDLFKYEMGKTLYDTFVMEINASGRIIKIRESLGEKSLSMALQSRFKSLPVEIMQLLSDRVTYNPKTAIPVPKSVIESAEIKGIPVAAVKANWYSNIPRGTTVNKRLNRIAESIGMISDRNIEIQGQTGQLIYLSGRSSKIEKKIYNSIMGTETLSSKEMKDPEEIRNDLPVVPVSNETDSIPLNTLKHNKIETNTLKHNETETKTPKDNNIEPETLKDNNVRAKTPKSKKNETKTPKDNKTEPETPKDNKTEPKTPKDNKIEANTLKHNKTEPETLKDNKTVRSTDVRKTVTMAKMTKRNPLKNPYMIKTRSLPKKISSKVKSDKK